MDGGVVVVVQLNTKNDGKKSLIVSRRNKVTNGTIICKEIETKATFIPIKSKRKNARYLGT